MRASSKFFGVFGLGLLLAATTIAMGAMQGDDKSNIWNTEPLIWGDVEFGYEKHFDLDAEDPCADCPDDEGPHGALRIDNDLWVVADLGDGKAFRLMVYTPGTDENGNALYTTALIADVGDAGMTPIVEGTWSVGSAAQAAARAMVAQQQGAAGSADVDCVRVDNNTIVCVVVTIDNNGNVRTRVIILCRNGDQWRDCTPRN